MKRAALIILDGWGYRTDPANNAVVQGGTPNLDALAARYPSSTLGASGLSVGLPDGQMGNSEVGHLNLGAGRIVYQELTRINLAVESGDIFANEALLDCAAKVKESGGALHLIGLLSDGGVHSHQEHLFKLVEFAKREGVKELFVHPLLDGRDTPPTSGAGFLRRLEVVLAEKGFGRIASVAGRFWGMDRDNRWERVERAFNAITKGEGERVTSPVKSVEEAYRTGETDEFIPPRVVVGEDGLPIGRVEDGDGVIFFNFRADRAREITRAFTEKKFDAFCVAGRPKLSSYLCMTEYDETFDLPVAFPPEKLEKIL
ncbi:MAG: 2,3-bisphosphoglycerate-independent phosphoglycerate mutase, partial [Deltaproteobacteria bacterium]